MREKIGSVCRALFGNSMRAFGTVALILLISLAIAPAKDYFSQWRHYQKAYLNTIRHRSDAVTLERHFEPGLQQIWIPEMGVVDRCATCHEGLKEASLKDVATQPFRPHPPIPHKLTEFGCVTCHRGQGPATTVEEAHHSTLAWEQPILPVKYQESGCGQCHLNALAGTPTLNQGRTLLSREGCVRCHALKLGDGTTVTATDDPPDLRHIADKTSREWIFAWIKNPQAYSATASMPNFGFSDHDASDLSAFLVSQSTPLTYGAAPAAVTDTGSEGQSLYGESFCASCHAMQNAAGNMVGGDVGPELTKVGSKVKPQWLADWLRNPGHYDPDTRMPHYRFDEKQIALLSGFLGSKTDSDFLANLKLDAATPEQIQHGKQLATEYGCASCHQINGLKRPENFAPDLSRVGSRSLAVLAFAPGVEHTLPDYIAAKIHDPRAFGSGLKMPRFSLTDQQIDALTTALLAQTDRQHTEPASLRMASAHESNYQPAGKAAKLIADLRCFSCHAINGRGGDMAPDLTWEGSSVQRKWLEDFLKNPNTLRPALIRRMPRFNLSQADIEALTDYIMTVYQSPAIDRDQAMNFTPAEVEQGRQLFYSKYNCQSCHIADYQKDKGYIGPALATVGTRLTAPWIFAWLKNPQALRPGAIEPNQHLSDTDAKALTAFLMNLKSSAKQGAK